MVLKDDLAKEVEAADPDGHNLARWPQQRRAVGQSGHAVTQIAAAATAGQRPPWPSGRGPIRGPGIGAKLD